MVFSPKFSLLAGDESQNFQYHENWLLDFSWPVGAPDSLSPQWPGRRGWGLGLAGPMLAHSPWHRCQVLLTQLPTSRGSDKLP